MLEAGWNYAGPRFRRLHALLPTARSLQVQYALKWVLPGQFGRVLVVGVGADPYRNLFAVHTQYITLDIDPSVGLIDVIGDAVALPFRDKSFDWVVCTEVLEYVVDQEQLGNEFHRVLAAGGTAMISVPFLFNYHYDLFRPTHQALRQSFRRFSETKIWRQGNRITTIWDLLTTSFWPVPVFAALRICTHLFRAFPRTLGYKGSSSSAPTGYFMLARR